MSSLVIRHSADWRIQSHAKAAIMLVAAPSNLKALSQLKSWSPATLLQALQLMSRPEGRHPSVRAYALRSLHTCPPTQARLYSCCRPRSLPRDCFEGRRKTCLNGEADGKAVYFSAIHMTVQALHSLEAAPYGAKGIQSSSPSMTCR